MRALLLFLTAGGMGCAASVVSLRVLSAEQALREAKDQGAHQKATYEYTMALRYLEKAREEVADNEFKIAEALAARSELWTERAVTYLETGARPGTNLDDLPDVLLPEAPTSPSASPPTEIEPDLLDEDDL